MTKRNGDFDPNDAGLDGKTGQLGTLVRAALAPFDLHRLTRSQREDVDEAARHAAREAALTYDPSSARTTKWKTAANAANYKARLELEYLNFELTESGVLGSIGSDAFDGDPGDLGAVGDPLYDDDDRSDVEVLGTPGAAFYTWLAEFNAINQLRPHLTEPDATILETFEDPVADVAQMIGITAEAVRQRRKRLRVRIQDVMANKLGAVPADAGSFEPRSNDEDPGDPTNLPRVFDPA